MNHHFPTASPVRDCDELAHLEEIDARVRDLALSFGACRMQYSALIERRLLQQAEYAQAFPHLLLTASRMRCPDVEGEAQFAQDNQTPTQWCLSPAVCYHTYAQLAGSVIAEPVLITARGKCFRDEAHCAPGVRQIEFEMREIVMIGASAWVNELSDSIRQGVEALARDIGLSGTWRVAEDPFFLPTAQGKAVLQRLLKTKLEYQADDRNRLALASVNRHGTFFGERFDITDAANRPVHTACIAIGLDRWSTSARGPEGAQEEGLCRDQNR